MLIRFFSDRRFFATFFKIAVPITIQQFVSSSTNMLDVLMVGQLGESSIAALGLSNQIFFLLALFLFGISSGSAIFTAQYWGKQDLPNLRKVMGIGLTMAITVALFYTILAVLIPDKILSLYTNDQEVVALGSQYLRIVGLSYLATSISFTYVSVLRSTENVKLPMMVTVLALSLNILLNYTLILGNFGFPAMGVKGAAIGTAIARSLECIAIVLLSYKYKTAAGAKLKELAYDFQFFKKVLKTSMPAAVNEFFWSLGITTYNAVYARIGTHALAAINISSTIESMSYVVFIGAANACAIMIGNQIGAGNEDVAYEYGNRFLTMGIVVAILMGGLVILVRPVILSFYNIEEISYQFAYNIQLIFGLALWIRVANLILFIGILRSGGDTTFALLVEMFSIWLIGVPAAFIGAFVLHWPVFNVYALVMLEEFVKLIIIFPRFRSKKWIHNLTAVTM
jgi:putative MATE family efflux protein